MIGLKVSKAIGIINHLKSIYRQRVLFTLYNSLIISHMLYGILLWGKSDNVDKIAKLQKRAIRTISFSRPIAHTEPLFKTFSLLKFNDIYTLMCYMTDVLQRLRPYISLQDFDSE